MHTSLYLSERDARSNGRYCIGVLINVHHAPMQVTLSTLESKNSALHDATFSNSNPRRQINSLKALFNVCDHVANEQSQKC